MSALCRFHGSAVGCKYGERCKYSHGHPQSIPICKHYQNGRCSFGLKCKYRHESIVQYVQSRLTNNQYDHTNNNDIFMRNNNNDQKDIILDKNPSKACFIWKINNIQFPLLFDGYIRGINNIGYVTKDIVSLCMDFYLEYDLIHLLKNLQRYNTFRSFVFNVGPFKWIMNISIGYRFDLILQYIPNKPEKIDKLEFLCTITFKEINKCLDATKIILSKPHNEQTINSMIHYFAAKDIEYFNSFNYKLEISDIYAFDIDGNDITNKFIPQQLSTYSCGVWTTTQEEWLKQYL